jgi:hypothetical protein
VMVSRLSTSEDSGLVLSCHVKQITRKIGILVGRTDGVG